MTAKKRSRATRKAPGPARKPPARKPGRTRALMWTAALVVLIGVIAFFPVAALTDRPAFCATCHGMQPFYVAWTQGPHKSVWCVDCHVDQGRANRLVHKFAALREVYDEFFTHATYPSYNADVPNARCIRCHPQVPAQTATPNGGKFSHALHLGKNVQCAQCHQDTGHRVSFASLQAAGVLNANNVVGGATYVGQPIASLQGKASVLVGHKQVPCSNCHDMANLQCSFCHQQPANHFGSDCRLCHRAGVPFAAFTHPPSGEHNYLSRPCAKCHPNGYTTVYCTCHKGRPPSGD